MKGTFKAHMLPLDKDQIDQKVFFEELIDANTKLEVYKAKIEDSKLDSSWYLPNLQQKEALASSLLEGTQATLDGVLVNQIDPNDKDKNLNEVSNYYHATFKGYDLLSKRDFSNEFFYDIHSILMEGNVRKPELIGEYRKKQNYIGRSDPQHSIVYTPPKAEEVPVLMDNLIKYMNNSEDNYRPLVRTAIIHAQFETIHPFMDGNGRVGRMLIPMYLYSKKVVKNPYFFISEALEQDKLRYYTLLNNTWEKGEWSEWIKYFLSAVTKQCNKYIGVIEEINNLYERDLARGLNIMNSAKMVSIINALYKLPIINSKELSKLTDISMPSLNRYLNKLVENQLLFTDNKKRNRTFYYYDLLDILRK